VKRTTAGILVRESEFVEDLARLPECDFDDCTSTVLVASDYCHEHFNQPGLERAIETRREAGRQALADPDWLPECDFAELAGVSVSQVNKDARADVLTSKKTETHRLIARAELRAYRATHTPRPKPTRMDLEQRVERAAALYREGLSLAQTRSPSS
jgi:hypothetical protein